MNNARSRTPCNPTAHSLKGSCANTWPPPPRSPNCQQVKAVLEQLGARYTLVELEQEEDGRPMRAELAKLTGRTSVRRGTSDGRRTRCSAA